VLANQTVESLRRMKLTGMAEAFLAWARDRSFSPSLSLALQRILQPLSPR